MKLVTSEKKLKMVSRAVADRNEAMQQCKLLQGVIDDYNGKLQGCSCIQYGQPLRGFIMRHPKTKEFSFVFNPKVLWKFGSKSSLEGCLSVEGRYFVKRPLIMKATWEDENGNTITKILLYKRARIFMHEVDHLDGLTIKMKGFGGFKC